MACFLCATSISTDLLHDVLFLVYLQMDSQDVALARGRSELSQMIDHFVIRPREETLEAAHRLYRLALSQGFTRGRVVKQVAAACLYIICRVENKPFMLLDYSDLLQVG